MTASSGRDFTIERGGTVIAGLQENGISYDGSPVDITNKTTNGYRTLGNFAGVQSFEISASGILDDETFQEIALNPATSKLLTDVVVKFPGTGELAGDVYVASMEVTGAHDGATTYSLTLQSSGPWTYTAVP